MMMVKSIIVSEDLAAGDTYHKHHPFIDTSTKTQTYTNTGTHSHTQTHTHTHTHTHIIFRGMSGKRVCHHVVYLRHNENEGVGTMLVCC